MNIQEFFEIGMKRYIPELLRSTGKQLEIGPGNSHVGLKYDDVSTMETLDYPYWDADKDNIPYPDGMFNVVHIYHVLEHVKDPVALLYEIQRVLAPGGHVNIVVPHASC